MKRIFLLLAIAGAYEAYGQGTTTVNYSAIPTSNRVIPTLARGLPINSLKYSGITGSPYFSETWMKGSLSSSDGTEYGTVLVRLDLLENSLIYLGANREELTPVIPVSKVSLRDTTTGKTYLFANSSSIAGSNSEAIWYQVLSSGKATLYKQFSKNLNETKSSYGSAEVERSIRTEERYFIGINNTVTRVKKFKDIINLVPGKSQELSDYIEKNNLNGKKESDFVLAVDYYNSITK